MQLETMQLWHQRARPTPTTAQCNVQLGCHLEEVEEMLECLIGENEVDDNELWAARRAIALLSRNLKAGSTSVFLPPDNREAFLDSLADQIVTAVGVGHCARMDTPQAATRVNTSNWSKFDADGHPIFDANGKIMKGPGYTPPDLAGLY